MLNCVIIEDEFPAREELKYFINNNNNFQINKEFENPIDALKYIEGNNIDVVFLDINMPELDGMSLGKIIHRFNKNIKLVFITAYKDFAIDAFEIKAFDYILKPYSEERIIKVLNNLVFHVSIEDPTVEVITESTFVVNDDNEVVAVEYTWTNSQGTESTKTPVDVVLGEEFTATVPNEEEDYTLKVYVTDQNNQTHEFTSDKTTSVIEEPVVNNADETNTDTVDETTVDNSAE